MGFQVRIQFLNNIIFDTLQCCVGEHYKWLIQEGKYWGHIPSGPSKYHRNGKYSQQWLGEKSEIESTNSACIPVQAAEVGAKHSSSKLPLGKLKGVYNAVNSLQLLDTGLHIESGRQERLIPYQPALLP